MMKSQSAASTMHPPFVVSLYVFAVVFLFFGGICFFVRLISGSRREGRSQDMGSEPFRRPPQSPEEWSRGPSVIMPPPMPRDDREYYQSAQDAVENNLPVPMPPPRHEREDW